MSKIEFDEYPISSAYIADATPEFSFSDTSILHRYPFLKQYAETINDIVFRLFMAEQAEKQRVEQQILKQTIQNHIGQLFGMPTETVQLQFVVGAGASGASQQETDIDMPYDLHTDHLTDEQEAWLYTHALGAIAFQLNMIERPMYEYLPEQIEQISGYMRRFFAIDVHVMPVIQENNRKTYAQFKFTRIPNNTNTTTTNTTPTES